MLLHYAKHLFELNVFLFFFPKVVFLSPSKNPLTGPNLNLTPAGGREAAEKRERGRFHLRATSTLRGTPRCWWGCGRALAKRWAMAKTSSIMRFPSWVEETIARRRVHYILLGCWSWLMRIWRGLPGHHPQHTHTRSHVNTEKPERLAHTCIQ